MPVQITIPVVVGGMNSLPAPCYPGDMILLLSTQEILTIVSVVQPTHTGRAEAWNIKALVSPSGMLVDLTGGFLGALKWKFIARGDVR